MSIYYGIEDIYLPPVPKPPLQQWDNYQIHDLYCEDIVYVTALETTDKPDRIIFRNFLAVERFNPIDAIECDFEAIAKAYP